jgi:hypothetical protein
MPHEAAGSCAAAIRPAPSISLHPRFRSGVVCRRGGWWAPLVNRTCILFVAVSGVQGLDPQHTPRVGCTPPRVGGAARSLTLPPASPVICHLQMDKSSLQVYSSLVSAHPAAATRSVWISELACVIFSRMAAASV